MQLVATIALVFLFGNTLSAKIIQLFYSISLVFKSCLEAFLPFMILAFVLTGILSFKKNAPKVLAVMIGLIFSSNGLIALLAYAVARLVIPLVACNVSSVSLVADNVVEPLFTFKLPVLLSSEKALLFSVVIGIVLSFLSLQPVEDGLNKFKNIVETILKKGFIPLLPLYVFGFLLKVHHEGMFGALFSHYGGAFLLIVSTQIVYLLWLYFVAAGFSFSRSWSAIQTALPSYVTAFSTMSSTVTIPVSVEAAHKNTGNKPLAQIAMPIMANVHLLGDSISTPLLAMVTMSLFLGCLPTFGVYAAFVFYFCTAMFAVSGIPGGGIIIMTPILISQLGFTPEMVSIITTLYFLLDAFGTAANVMGDGALVIIVDKVLKKLKIS